MASPLLTTPATATTALPSAKTLTTQLSKTGYTIIPSLLSPSSLLALRTATTSLTALARAGHWPHVRTVGKQFPPWPLPSPSAPLPIWGLQHLLHPELPLPKEMREEFVKVYFDKGLLECCEALVGMAGGERARGEKRERGELVMELFNLLVTPKGIPGSGEGGEGEEREEGKGKGFSLRWHRDDIPWSATAEEEAALLGHPAWHAQWNLPLYDDDSLVVVPGSHARPRTDAEKEAGPYDEDMPGAVRVALKAGDVVFYDNNILHRGVYDSGKERATLHGSVGHVAGSKARARNVLQHGVGEYVEGCDFVCLGNGKAREVAEGMRRRLVEMGRENTDVGFSLDG